MINIKRLNLIIPTLILISIIVFFQWENIEILYFKWFKKSAFIEHVNSKGQPNGELISYSNGKLNLQATFADGMKEGWALRYHDNGQLKNKIFYTKDKAEGLEQEYYKDGKLNYSANWRNNKRFGSEYHYSVDGKLENYDAFDLLALMCYVGYDEFQNIIQKTGGFISTNLYSNTQNPDSAIILQNKNSYRELHGLNIVVATPPGIMPHIDVSINDEHFYDLKIVDNVIKINDAFIENGNYNIVVKGQFLDKKKNTTTAETVELQIVKKD
jgi:hypothetical protein